MLISAELRWFWPEACPANVASWFHGGNLPTGDGRVRVDRYFHQSGNTEIGCKIRDAHHRRSNNVEMKALISRLPKNHIEIWGKWRWDAPLDLPSIMVRKTRRLRLFALSGHKCEIPLDGYGRPDGQYPSQSCQVELTKVTIEGCEAIWWTFGLEAAGEPSTAPLVLARALDLLGLPPIEGELASYPMFLERQGRLGERGRILSVSKTRSVLEKSTP